MTSSVSKEDITPEFGIKLTAANERIGESKSVTS